jgi:tRNA 5-methylaminomethyl-2-thiouridine biosynthesis bifunctional protein
MSDQPTTPYNDIYFSRQDGLAEKTQVFIEGNDLPRRLATLDQGMTIVEAGFGTGLSFLAAARAFLVYAPKDAYLYFYSFEQYPLAGKDMVAVLAPWRTALGGMLDDLIAALPLRLPGWHTITLWGRIRLTLIYGDLQQTLPQLDASVDAWFLDGFAPAKNPAMWGPELWAAMARLSGVGATAATYSAARVVKDGLQAAGFTVHKIPGFAHKSDRLIACYNGPGRARFVSPIKRQVVHIYGGGLAACAATQAVLNAGHQAIVIAPHGLADGASGNIRGLYNPRLLPPHTPAGAFYTASFAAMNALLDRLQGPQGINAWRVGALHLLRNDAVADKAHKMLAGDAWRPDDAAILDAAAASDRARLSLSTPALWLPHSGSVDPRALCAWYARDADVVVAPPPGDPDAVIIATAWAAREHPALRHLPLRPVRGQVTQIRATPSSRDIQTHLCFGGYLTPADQNGVHMLGATFDRDDFSTDLRAQDHDRNLAGLAAHVPTDHTAAAIMGGRAGVRVTTPDHAPLIGRIQSPSGPPLFITLAHGSHGILSSLMAGLVLADQIAQAPPRLPSHALQWAQPGRFTK